MTLVTTTSDDARQVALLKAVGLDRVAPEQRELALAIANRYNLDPMLRHLVMIDGKPYITRDGLLHVAHQSKQLDGIEVTDPVKTEDGKHWTVKASVYRKDMSRPFTYSGRYPVDGKNRVYAPEMAVKVAEVMALRRAFDIAAPVLEERWDIDDAPVAPPVEPVSLTERIASRAEAISAPPDVENTATLYATTAPEPEERTESAASDEADTTVDDVEEAVLVAPMEPAESAALPIDDEGHLRDADLLPEDFASMTVEADARATVGITKDEFATRIAGIDRNEVKSVAKKLYPDITKFADLDGYQLETIALMLEMGATGEDQPPEPATVANGGIVLCGDVSPLSGATCTLDQGHKSKTHRAGVSESW
jgi:hypothetical protein